MRPILIAVVMAALVVADSQPLRTQRAADSPANLLWYRAPAVNWDEALPIGNGRLGAMVFGGVVGE
jgi:alpha-L-fucosidase 2